MLIKTNLLDKIDKSLPLAYLNSFDGTDFSFTCNCGMPFTMNGGNRYVSDDQYACSNCKRKSRLLPYVGERYVFRRVKSDAVTAGREFRLDFDWFVKMVHLPCFYCHRKDINVCIVPSRREGEALIEQFRYNGIDRMDNDIGYIESNCVPSCIICNRAKNSMPFEEFMEWLDVLVDYRQSLPV